MNKRMVAYCGLDCCECTAYKATKANDNAARKKVASEWNARHGWSLKAEDINCDGCLPVKGGRLFSFCASCNVRNCAIEKGLPNCGPCPDYACAKLTAMPWFAERGKPNLDRVKNKPR